MIKTDQRSLKHLLEQKVTTPLQHTWLFKLMGYDYEIMYKKDKENVAADALSRVQGSELVAITVSSIEPALLGRIQNSWKEDIDAQHIIRSLEAGEEGSAYAWDGTMLTRKGKLVIGNDLNLRRDLLFLYHASAIGGHSGVHATLQRIRQMILLAGTVKICLSPYSRM